PVHPINSVVGGFTAQPDHMTLQVFAARLRAAIKDAVATVDLFARSDIFDFHPGREKLALQSPNGYAVLSDSVEVKTHATRSGQTLPVENYHDFIRELPTPEAGNAKFSFLQDGEPFMVGALARVNSNWDTLMPAAAGAAEAAAKASGIEKGADNPYLNNVCQAVEIVDALQRCAALCEKLAASYDVGAGDVAPPVKIELKEAIGYAASEAPRGTLYYSIGLDEAGFVTSGDVITPTAQNLACIEADLRTLAPLLDDMPQEDMITFIEKLIRAYDPCLSCAVH
ncbi:MAG: nickel-dependent hydrogenase large subunit, partial [Coriobacteriia bacterium]|nr:nickel-dependent hydrogenase large subunit [Coriobacteriia bacterium]